VRSIREYDLTRQADKVRVARGRAELVYMDFRTGQPSRVPDAWQDAFTGKGKPEDLGIRLTCAQATTDAFRYVHQRRVQFHELDAVAHVNHAVYLQWVEQAAHDVLRTVQQGALDNCRAHCQGHEIQYYAAALDNERVEVVSWVCAVEETAIAWTHEIYNADTRKLLARDYARMSFVNAGNEPAPPSPQLLNRILVGPSGTHPTMRASQP
jgi:YbgC/YbaW family acyl-CoA thioester hydrolase